MTDNSNPDPSTQYRFPMPHMSSSQMYPQYPQMMLSLPYMPPQMYQPPQYMMNQPNPYPPMMLHPQMMCHQQPFQPSMSNSTHQKAELFKPIAALQSNPIAVLPGSKRKAQSPLDTDSMGFKASYSKIPRPEDAAAFKAVELAVENERVQKLAEKPPAPLVKFPELSEFQKSHLYARYEWGGYSRPSQKQMRELSNEMNLEYNAIVQFYQDPKNLNLQ